MKKENKENCVFCKIIQGIYDSSKVYEDDLCLAFMDIQPVNEGHILIIPKEHIPYIEGLNEDVGSHLFKVGMRVNKALRKTNIRCEGINYFLSDGEAAMQEVFHTHLHVFPRYKEDGFGLKFSDKYFNKTSREELNQIAEEIKKHL